MIYLALIIITLVLILAALEISARIYYRLKFLIPFRSRRIGEYPYGKFIEKADSPLEYRFKKGFKSDLININRFRCRGPEPARDNTKKRIMLIGESIFFGVKLLHENDIWSARLEKILAAGGIKNWEVINAGNPIYNSYQHRLLWEQDLHRAKPDILLVEIGANDVSQAWMMGTKWEPGTPWPWEFIMALERKSPWWNKLFSRFCLYFFFRRNMTARKKFPRWDDDIKWDACLDFIAENYKAILENAEKEGIKVAIVTFAMAYDQKVTPEQARSLEAIQANWQSFIKGKAEYDDALMDFTRNKIGRELGIPCIDLGEAFRKHPERYQLYLDLVHYNARGMEVVAKTIYDNIARYGWLKRTEEQNVIK